MVSKFRKGLRGRSITLPACILVYNSISVAMCIELGFNITFALVSPPEQSNNCWAPFPQTDESKLFIVYLIQSILFFALYPLLGWLTDAFISRERAMKMSLIICWFGSLLQVVSYCIQYGTCGLPTSFAKYGLSLVALVCLMIGTACYQVNILAYGLDQMFEKATSQIRSFIHWIVWGQYVGFVFAYIAFIEDTIYNRNLILFSGVSIFLACSVSIVLNSVFGHIFGEVCSHLVNKNPYKLVYQVLLYAKAHKGPEGRSALTYWENNTPDRISLGKSKYGGPFADEEVENVKTFLRMVVIFIATFGFYIPYYIIVNDVLSFVNALSGATVDVNGYGAFLYWNILNKTIIIIIPILELVILPIFPKIEFFLLNPLKGFGIAYVLMILTLITMFIIDTVGHFITPDGDFCSLSKTSSDKMLNVSYYYYFIPFLLGGVADITGFITILEFICSQSPINMSGMLTGCFFFIRGLCVAIGPYIQLPFSSGKIAEAMNGSITCTFWILLINLTISIVGFFVYIFIYRWYTNRKRGEEYNVNKTVEENFDKYLPKKNDSFSLHLDTITSMKLKNIT